jgi:hypothetical protein
MSSWLIPPLLALITSITIFANLLVFLDFFFFFCIDRFMDSTSISIQKLKNLMFDKAFNVNSAAGKLLCKKDGDYQLNTSS